MQNMNCISMRHREVLVSRTVLKIAFYKMWYFTDLFYFSHQNPLFIRIKIGALIIMLRPRLQVEVIFRVGRYSRPPHAAPECLRPYIAVERIILT